MKKSQKQHSIIPSIKTKKQLIKELASRTKLTQIDCEYFLDYFISIFEDACYGLTEVNLVGLGQLKHSIIEAHEGSKPTPGKTGEYEKIWIPESVRTTFVLSKDLKNLHKLNNVNIEDNNSEEV